MKTSVIIPELQRLAPKELERELKLKMAEAAHMRLGLEIQKEKNHAAYKALRKDIARMTMVLGQMKQKNQTNQKNQTSESVVSSKEKASQTAKVAVKDTGSEKARAKPAVKKSKKTSSPS